MYKKEPGFQKAITNVFSVITVIARIFCLVIAAAVLCMALQMYSEGPVAEEDAVNVYDILFISFFFISSSIDMVLNLFLKNNASLTDVSPVFMRKLALKTYLFAIFSRLVELAYFVSYWFVFDHDVFYLYAAVPVAADMIFCVVVVCCICFRVIFDGRRLPVKSRETPRVNEYNIPETIPEMYPAAENEIPEVPQEIPAAHNRAYGAGKKKPSLFKRSFNLLRNIVFISFAVIAAIVAAVMISNSIDSKDFTPYSPELMTEALEAAWTEGAEDIHLQYANDSSEYSTDIILSDLKAYFDTSFSENLPFMYELENVEYNVGEESGHFNIDVDFNYTGSRFSDLEYFADRKDALLPLTARLAEGECVLEFLVDSSWTIDDLDDLANDISINDVHTAAEWTNWNRYILSVPDNDKALASIEKIYDLDEDYLNSCSAELDAKLDELANDIWAKNLSSEREMYRAAARAIISAASYDDDSLLSALTDNLTDEQKVNRSAYGAVVTGKTVCSGYSYAFKALCDKLGLDCWVISGYNGSGRHAWNIIKDGLHMDCTFADDAYSENYLFMDSDDLELFEYHISVNQITPW